MDPAAETFEYQPEVDVRELITADDVMDVMELGPNGALVYCMEYLLDNLRWLEVRQRGERLRHVSLLALLNHLPLPHNPHHRSS
jgi:hypothetical protein